ncbi:Dolichyl-diphosphooligosaccharide-protein glycosyltransferase 48 kDa subunit [Smittium mucronatum]|uniref:Dolichyl-diphosphooligosaccharide--protein glycosyltransferase subunit WBP1 n=1 Tax=Smittium mucronatum TaxID=133383 RepID=A0A1R0GNX4_9FUNG|nr:Dolichyl-diphosphooligosaccharide-protein glycosyltransferase 48 kDa subunit [Smittium mucronatum]
MPLFDHVVFLCSKCKRYGKGIGKNEVSKYVKAGGNIVFGMSPDFSVLNSHIASEFGLSFENLLVVDQINYLPEESKNDSNSTAISPRTTVITDNLTDNGYILPGLAKSKRESQIYFRGVPHTISRKSPLIVNVMSAPSTSYALPMSSALDTSSQGLADSSYNGFNIKLASVIQARNNARAAFVGSIDVFTNKFLRLNTKENVYSNKDFIVDLTKWTFQETGVIKSLQTTHHKVGELEPLKRYRIKDTITFETDISLYQDGKWVPYLANDVQLEIRMIDPYIRTTLTPSPNDQTSTKFSKDITLPDKYGVFKFIVNYKRYGLSNLVLEKIIPIEPLRHDQFPRFLTQAYPYYATSFFLLLGFVAICYLFIFVPDFSSTTTTTTSSTATTSTPNPTKPHTPQQLKKKSSKNLKSN